MTTLSKIDSIDNYNDLLIELESQLAKDNLNKEFLIREIFALWYFLLEGIKCENFSDDFINTLLKKRYNEFLLTFIKDSDFNFIIGWMASVAPWYFSDDLSEDDGYKLLYKAYKLNSKNKLYKWAMRDHLNLSSEEIKRLKDDLKDNFCLYFNYGTMIKQYFLSVLSS